MTLNIKKEVAAMERMTIGELRGKYAEVFGERTNGRHKEWLIKRIAWRMQANVEGDLSERARRRAMELANDADLRVTAPRKPRPDAERRTKTVVQPATDTLPDRMLVREYKGRKIVVNVTKNGFEFEGERYRSLSAIAKAVTGSHWSGHRFFGIQKGGDK